jgi:hypothetical protein
VGKFPYIGHWYEGWWTINAADWSYSYSIPHHSTACSCWNNESQSEIMDARGLAQRWVYDSELPIYGYQCSNKWYKWSPRALDALDPIIFNHPLKCLWPMGTSLILPTLKTPLPPATGPTGPTGPTGLGGTPFMTWHGQQKRSEQKNVVINPIPLIFLIYPMTDPWCCYIWCSMDPINIYSKC